jgi:APA family basic amino acid/polyamine antiporter
MTGPETTSAKPSLSRSLGLFDAVMILVGGVIGSGIFLTAGAVAESLRRPGLFILVWIVGGIISLLACFSVAELAGMYPHAGGQYIYLREAYGELPAFLYGWMIFSVVQTGTIAALAVGFAQYFCSAIPAFANAKVIYSVTLPFTHGSFDFTYQKIFACISIMIFTVVNIFGVRHGSNFVNFSTWIKFLVMAALAILGFAIGKGDLSHFTMSAENPVYGFNQVSLGFGIALISVLFAYDGWIYVTWVAGEVKDSAKNVPRALVFGIGIVAILYTAMNMAYLYALPLGTIMNSKAVVSDAATALFSPRWGTALALLVALSCLGAMCSAILCTARIFYAMAQDGVFFSKLAEIHPTRRTPVFSLIAQCVWAVVLALVGVYDQLITYAIFMMIVSYTATVGALFILRRKYPLLERPYRCIGYPFVPLAYLIFALVWTANTLWQSPIQSLGGLAIVALGIPGYLYWTRNRTVIQP